MFIHSKSSHHIQDQDEPLEEAKTCPLLAGQMFYVVDEHGIDTGVVKIQSDLSYQVAIEGEDFQPGQLIQVGPRGDYRYHENGPPVVEGALFCVDGQWMYFDDGADDFIGGSFRPVNR